MARWLPLLSLGLLLGLLVPRPADACTPPLPGITDLRPRSGARVPANGLLYVSGYDLWPFSAEYLDFDVFIPLPQPGELGPLGVVYLGPISQGPVDPGGVQINVTKYVGDTPQTVSVTLGVDPNTFDFTPPILGRQVTLLSEWREDQPGLCEPGGWVVTYRTTAARDELGVSAYRLLAARGREALQPVLTQLAPLDPTAQVSLVHHAGFEDGVICYRVVAIDVAGNEAESESSECVILGESLDAGVSDAGTIADGGAPADGGPRGDGGALADGLATDDGCACTGARRPAARDLVGLGLLLGLLGLYRRR
jgi:hypothetical protein